MRPLRLLVDDFEWVHAGIGLAGNVLFIVGSVLFLVDAPTSMSGTTFIAGSTLMFVGAVGRLGVKLQARHRAKRRTGRRTAALSGS